MMTYHMSFDQVLDMTLSQFSACCHLAHKKVACEYQENYKMFMSKSSSDVERIQQKIQAEKNKFNMESIFKGKNKFRTNK